MMVDHTLQLVCAPYLESPSYFLLLHIPMLLFAADTVAIGT